MGVGTTSLVRATLGLGSAAGVGTAIGAPIALNVQSPTENVSQNLRSNGVSQVSISKCVNDSGDSIDFGDTSTKTACGSVKNDEGKTNSTLAEDNKYTHLFQNMGNNRNGSGSSGTNYGATSCTKNKGTFGSQGSGSESLGLCDDSQSTDQGLTIKDNGKTTVEVCSGDCFGSQSAHDGKTLTYSQTKGEGKQIQFRKLL